MTEDIWNESLRELRLQMTTATFNTWLVNSRLLSVTEGKLVVGVSNAYAMDWLQNRLIDVVERVVTAVAGRTCTVEFRIDPAHIHQEGAETLTLKSPEGPPEFIGFEPIRSNYTQMPKQFFEVVLRSEPSVVTAFVAAVIDQTYGIILNYHTGERREWWEASKPEISRTTGIKSLASVGKAIAVSRANGYIIRSKGKTDFRYRLRRIGEPLDRSIKK